MKTIKNIVLILTVGLTVSLNYKNSSKQALSLNNIQAFAQDIEVEEITAEQAARQLGGSWIGRDGRIHTIYLDHNGGSNNDDHWDNFLKRDKTPQQYQEVKTASGKAAYAYATSQGIGISYNALSLTNSTQFGSIEESNTEYTQRYGVACPSGTTSCEAITPPSL